MPPGAPEGPKPREFPIGSGPARPRRGGPEAPQKAPGGLKKLVSQKPRVLWGFMKTIVFRPFWLPSRRMASSGFEFLRKHRKNTVRFGLAWPAGPPPKGPTGGLNGPLPRLNFCICSLPCPFWACRGVLWPQTDRQRQTETETETGTTGKTDRLNWMNIQPVPGPGGPGLGAQGAGARGRAWDSDPRIRTLGFEP